MSKVKNDENMVSENASHMASLPRRCFVFGHAFFGV